MRLQLHITLTQNKYIYIYKINNIIISDKIFIPTKYYKTIISRLFKECIYTETKDRCHNLNKFCTDNFECKCFYFYFKF